MALIRNAKGQFIKGQHWRKPKAHWNYYWLYGQYIILGKSAADIAKAQGCTENNILAWLHKHNIPRRSIIEARQLKYWGLNGKVNGMYGRTGAANPNWKGGISADRQSLYSSQEWKDVSVAVWKRDKGSCQRCAAFAGSNQDRSFHIHHIVSLGIEDSRTDAANLILLCKKCHHWVHSKENNGNEFIG